MLKFMRKHATGYLVKGMFGLIIIVFIFWGVGSFRAGERVIAEVGPYKVSFTEYQETYNKLLNMYRMIYKDKFDENVVKELKLKEKAMDEIIDRYVLIKKAKELGITTSEEEFINYIANMEMFRRDGKFNEKVYVEVLKRNGIDPKRFEESERVSLTISKMVNIINDNGMFLNEADVWAGYIKEKGKINLAFIQFDPSALKGHVNVNEKELTDLYEKEKGIHKEENVYRLKYLLIDEKSSVRDDVAYLDLLKIKDIAAYGKQKGIEVIDLGDIKVSELLKRFKDLKIDEWLKGLKKGDISLPVRADTKSYIFQLVDMEEGKLIDKGRAIQTIKERIVNEKAKSLAKVRAGEAISQKLLDSKKETGFIQRNSYNIPGIGLIPKEHVGVLTLSKTHPVYEKPVEVSGKYYVFYFKDEKLPDKSVWEKEKEAYRRYLLTKTREEFFKSFMEGLRNKEKIKIDWKEI
ncbi:MAG: SurA N-terminal domain-containing protein [Proteobacteria bacterium]|jgi:parvulin-like peptidyl-prolyl isomerase|nr:SurA N-terminal domain-containing protein [Pseudomonadota bacterium]